MYCVKCGVKLQESVGSCPLCGTPVWNPEGSGAPVRAGNAYPETLPPRWRETTLPAAIALTVLCGIAAAVVLAICFRLYGALRWGGYAVGGILLFYVIVVLPLWFPHPRQEVFVPVSHAAAGLYLLFICLRTGGHWFLRFAFPVLCLSCLLSTALICLLKYVERGRLYIFGGFLLLLGGFAVLAEFFEHIAFGTQMFLWSLFPLAGFGAVGLFLLAAGMIPPLRQALQKRFFF